MCRPPRQALPSTALTARPSASTASPRPDLLAVGSTGGDLLELYCGNGNFTVALAPNFRKVSACSLLGLVC